MNMQDSTQWIVTIVVAVVTSFGTFQAAKVKSKADVDTSKTSVESVYIAEMREIIEDYKLEREALKAEKEKLQALVDKVQKINRELEEDKRVLKLENKELKKENGDLKKVIKKMEGSV